MAKVITFFILVIVFIVVAISEIYRTYQFKKRYIKLRKDNDYLLDFLFEMRKFNIIEHEDVNTCWQLGDKRFQDLRKKYRQ